MGILETFSLKGKTALITGGAGKLGRKLVQALSEAGAGVTIASRHFEELEKVAAEFRSKGFDVSALSVDLGDEQSIIDLKNQLMARLGHIDILVNNASIKTMSGWDDSGSAFIESMKINAGGLFLISRAFGDEMAKQGSGSIINIGSTYGLTAPDLPMYEGTGIPPYLPDYSFQKGGMSHFTRFVASYYGPHHVRCNCVCPIGIENDQTPPKFVENYSQRTFLGRMASPADMMGIVVFLASDASSYITGVNIPVDGGYTAR
jgi:NAD(P)-dependent dehydrogenase (short-subunit alcohol dehydrogenase family)